MPVPEIDVPDLNVWLALIDPDHEHHTRARRYWEHEASGDMAFCRVTMLGLLRLLLSLRVLREGHGVVPTDLGRVLIELMETPKGDH